MFDEVTSKAVFNGEQWLKESYFLKEDGTGYTLFDGEDHEDVEEADLPSLQEHEASWESYRQFVHEHGVDPLDEYIGVRHTYKRKACYEVRLRNSICGPRVHEWCRGRAPWEEASSMPLDLASYICMTYYKDHTCEEVVNKAGYVVETQDRHDDGSWTRNRFRWQEYIDLLKVDEHVTYHFGRHGRLVIALTLIETVDRTPGAIARDLRRITQEKKS